MRKILTFLIILISIVACKKSDKEILEKTISMLDGIERVRYQSTFQATESGTTYLEKTDTLFFDFKGKMGASTPRYFLKDSVTELIFDGKIHIQSLSNEKVVLTDDSANPNNPLLITLFPIKVFLPKLLANQDVTIIRKKDSLITQKNNYVFDITINNGYLDWEKLEIRSGVGNDTKYSLTVRKSDLAPVKFVMQNGESGSFSRTMENFDFDYLPSEELWTGSHFPSEYSKMTYKEYHSIQRDNFKKIGENNHVSREKLNSMELPNLDNDSIVKISNHKGDLVLLEFWFKYCGPCVQAVPKLNAIREKYEDQNFELYGIEFKQEFDKENLQKYVKKIKMNYPSLYEGEKLSSELGVTAAPSFVLLNRNGEVVYTQSGFNEEEIIKVIEENL